MSDREFPLYTVKTDCQDCYKCVRRCPVKAIKIEDSRAMIIPDLCVACGICYKVCPAKAKQMRNDLSRAKYLIKAGKPVYVSLAPSWITEFGNVPQEKMVAAIRRLGIQGVSETALGAEEVSCQTAKILEKAVKKGENAEAGSRLFLSTACPTVVEYVEKYLPELAPNLTNVSSPLLAHCRMLKDEFGTEIETVFIGPCIAKKLEADRHPELLSLSLSFGDLRQWLKDEGVNIEETKPGVFDKFVMKKAQDGTAYPIEGGMIETIKPYEVARKAYLMQITGLNNIRRELQSLSVQNLDKPIFIECLACEGGCVNGPCITTKKSGLAKRIDILRQTEFNDDIAKRKPQADIKLSYNPERKINCEYSESDIKHVLTQIGKYTTEDELNCGGCGYDTCRNFAKALLDGKAEPEMCVSHMKHQAQRKANALLRCIPAPIVIADSQLKIMEYNDEFADTFWNEDEHSDIYDRNNLQGANLRDFVSFTNLFSASLDLEQDIRREHIRQDEKLFDVVVFNIDKKQSVGGIIEDVTNMEMRKEQIAEKAKEVIHKNLATVQQIACTLGEHMAETEVLLRSIAKDFSSEKSKEDDTVTIRTNSNKREY